MRNSSCILIDVLRDTFAVKHFSLTQWDLLIRQARRADLLGRIAVLMQENDLFKCVPAGPHEHLVAGLVHAEKHKQVMSWEISRIQDALEKLDIPVIFLKGAAYVIKGLPPARGRIYADVDIMVPKSELANVEKTLMIHGWQAIKLDAYDQRYYRKWMHEIPPLRHRRRLTVIDVHHRILPETTKAQPDPASMFERAMQITKNTKEKTLDPVDMVLHSAVHLFYEGEFEHGLRDIVDLDDLFRYYEKDITFWQALVTRAKELELEIPLYYAIRYTNKLLGTPIQLDNRMVSGLWNPNRISSVIMDFLFLRVLRPMHASCEMSFSRLAHFLLYLRSHVLRMPVYLLIPHLLRKAFYRNNELEQ